MKRIAIAGGGIAGLTAAYECEKQRLAGADLDWHLYEASSRLGGVMATTRIDTPEGRFVLEDGPDGWVTEKPWARELAEELGLGAEIIACKEATRKTYVLVEGKLQRMPAKMRMMVPEDLSTLEGSALFSDAARAAYAKELADAMALKANAPASDESVASFVERHFGKEVLEKIGAPLLGGVFGGDARKLSVQAVMPKFVAMEREHGSLIAALQARARERGERASQPAFESLKRGMGSLVEALAAKLPADRVHLDSRVTGTFCNLHDNNPWHVTYDAPDARKSDGTRFLWDGEYEHFILATPVNAARSFLPGANYDLRLDKYLPEKASSAVLVAMGWESDAARFIRVPEGFGFLVPEGSAETTLLAATFVDQKYPHRCPQGARILRAFFGGRQADSLLSAPDATVIAAAHEQLSRILGTLPDADAKITTVRRWPRSLPQYEVGHLERMKQLEEHKAKLPGLVLLGNAYHGVGVPDLVRDARAAVQKLL